MHHHVGELALIGPAGERRDEDQMAGGGDGEELGDALHHRQNDDLL